LPRPLVEDLPLPISFCDLFYSLVPRFPLYRSSKGYFFCEYFIPFFSADFFEISSSVLFFPFVKRFPRHPRKDGHLKLGEIFSPLGACERFEFLFSPSPFESLFSIFEVSLLCGKRSISWSRSISPFFPLRFFLPHLIERLFLFPFEGGPDLFFGSHFPSRFARFFFDSQVSLNYFSLAFSDVSFFSFSGCCTRISLLPYKLLLQALQTWTCCLFRLRFLTLPLLWLPCSVPPLTFLSVSPFVPTCFFPLSNRVGLFFLLPFCSKELISELPLFT